MFKYLSTVFRWCEEEGILTVFLGTMLQFKGAHQFYEKNGCYQIPQTDLPLDFIHNPIDDVFYRKSLLQK